MKNHCWKNASNNMKKKSEKNKKVSEALKELSKKFKMNSSKDSPKKDNEIKNIITFKL